MGRKISTWTTEAPGSTSDLIGNVGSTTKRFTAQQILSIPITAQGDLLFGDSSADTTRLAAPTSGAILVYSSASSAVVWAVMDPGELLTQTTAAVTTVVTIPTSGAILRYSTVDGSVGPGWAVLDPDEILVGTSALAIPSSGAVLVYSTAATSGPVWSKPTSGAVLVASNVGTPTWLAIGTSGQRLETTGGSPAWVAANTITTAGTSGQFLQTTGGAASWEGITAGTILYGNSSGEVTELPIGTSGQQLESTGGTLAWRAAGGAAGATTNAWRIRHSVNQSLSSGWQPLAFNIDDIDTDAAHSTGAGSSAVTVPTSGTYLFGFGADMRGSSGEAYGIRILEGTTVVAQIDRPHIFSSNSPDSIECNTLRYFATSGVVLIPQIFGSTVSTAIVTGAATPVFWGHRLS